MKPSGQSRVLLLHCVFGLSGVAALGLQLIWIRRFGAGLGQEWPAVLGVLSAYFLGLAAGSLCLGKSASSSPAPVRVGMILELKVEGIGAEASSIVKRIGFTGSLMYASFLQQELMRVRQAEPGALMMMLMDEQLPKDPLADAVALRASHVGLHYSTVTPRLIQTCHNVGLQVFAYTVNSLEDIQKMKTLSLDGIMSDFPDRI